MARKKSKKSSKSPQLWQWALVAGAAFLLYYGLQHWLNPSPSSEAKRTATVKLKAEKPAPPPGHPKTATPTPTPQPQSTAGPLAKWTFQNAARFLPADAYPDNYSAQSLGAGPSGILAYAKTLPGKKPGPQGLTNTEPGLRAMVWDGQHYQSKELDFSPLSAALGGLKLVGPPQVERKAWISDGATVFPTKLYLNDETRLLVAYLLVDANGPRWAPLQTAEGTTGVAAFLQGTTAAVTRKVRRLEQGGKSYIVVERGSLDLKRPEAGYQWRVEAFAWNGKSFAYDKDLSATLTKEKKSE